MMLGAQLRRLREAGNISREQAGQAIRASTSKICRLELGRTPFKRRDVADLLTLYGVVGSGERETMLALAEQAGTPGWWHQYNDLLPGWFEVYDERPQRAGRVGPRHRDDAARDPRRFVSGFVSGFVRAGQALPR
ncbi:helix-turn-helix domain-containing protein [Microbispora hainanensis]